MTPRIVSLLPSATEIVHALGLGKYQVGRSHECDFPLCVKTLPVCTSSTFDSSGSSGQIDKLVKERLAAAVSLYRVDNELLHRLEPTHVLTQTLCDVCAVSLADVEAAFAVESGVQAQIVSLEANRLDDVWTDIRLIARACGVAQSGEQVIQDLQSRIADIATRAEEAAWHPRVAAIEWLDPLMAAGNWVPELLATAAAENLFGRAGEHSPWMKTEDLLAADPDVIIALPCGFDVAKTRIQMQAMIALPGWADLKAAQAGNVFLCDGNQFMNRPGPRLVESLQIFAEILHPDLFAPELEGVGWERY